MIVRTQFMVKSDFYIIKSQARQKSEYIRANQNLPDIWNK